MFWYFASALIYTVAVALIVMFVAKASRLRDIGDRTAHEFFRRKRLRRRSEDYREAA